MFTCLLKSNLRKCFHISTNLCINKNCTVSKHKPATFSKMAFRGGGATGKWKSIIAQSSLNAGNANRRSYASKRALKADDAPIIMIGGFVLIAVSIGVHTVKQHLVHSPEVKVTKDKRGKMYEVDDPDKAIANGDKFINKSFLRQVGHIQDVPETTGINPFTRSRDAETLRTAGVHK